MIDTHLTRTDYGPRSLLDYEAPLTEYLGAKWEEAFVRNPVPSGLRMTELWEAERGRPKYFYDEMGEIVVEEAREPETPKVSIDEANRRGKEYGLSFDYEPTEASLKILIDRKQAEIHRRQIVERANVGVSGASLGFLTELAATSVDPINLASAFIPIAGPARAGALAAMGRAGYKTAATRVGKTGGRALTGALEGAGGAAIVEPLIVSAAIAEQADYDEYDAFLNIVFGGVLGGGLHVIGGKTVDWAQKISERIHRIALEETIADMEAGRISQVGWVLKHQKEYGLFDASVKGGGDLGATATLPERHKNVAELIRSKFPEPEKFIEEKWSPPPKPPRPKGARPKSINQILGSRDFGGIQDPRGELKALDLHRNKRLVNKGGRDIDYAREHMEELGVLDEGSTPADLLTLMDEDARGNRVYTAQDRRLAEEWAEYDALVSEREHIMDIAKSIDEISGPRKLPKHIKDNAIDRVLKYGGDIEDAIEDAVRELDYYAGRAPDADVPRENVPFEGEQRFDWRGVLRDRAKAADNPRNDRLADFDSMERKQEFSKEYVPKTRTEADLIKEDMDGINESLKAMAEDDEQLAKSLDAAYRESSEELAEAAKMNDAVDAYASCMARD